MKKGGAMLSLKGPSVELQPPALLPLLLFLMGTVALTLLPISCRRSAIFLVLILMNVWINLEVSFFIRTGLEQVVKSPLPPITSKERALY